MINLIKLQPFVLLIAAILLPLGAAGQNSRIIRDKHVEAAVIGEMSHLQPGVSYRIGLLLRHDPGWHTYWKSTSTGYATSVEWELPEGFSISDLQWPTPKVYDFQGWTEYVYEGEVLLMATLQVPADLEVTEVEIGFAAEWLMCEDVCIPGGVTSSLTLPVSPTPANPSPDWAALFLKADQGLPAKPGPYALSASRQGRGVLLRVEGPDLPESAYFFDAQALFDPGTEAAIITRTGDRLELQLPLDSAAEGLPGRLKGVLKTPQGWSAADGRASIDVDLAISEKPLPGADAGSSLRISLFLLAFAGGLILNLMPCVFPVLGIKIMGFVSQAGESRGRIISHGLAFTTGVLLSFWILAGMLLVLRSGGSQLGWGFQLQSPGFVLALTFLLFAFALNMSGLFEVGQSAVGVGSKLTGKSGLGGSFFSGILATVVATPCAAPFLAPALGAALALPALASLAIFTAIAIGLATPYLLLSAFPGMIKWLPKPGAWMETFKQFMGFLLYATVAYLLWVLAGQLTEAGGYTAFALLKVLLSLVVAALSLWIYGRWGAFHKARHTRLKAVVGALLLMTVALWTGFSGTTRTDALEAGLQWEKWAPGKAEAYAGEGKFVYVDFTARWCVTCQTNKVTVFSSDKVLLKLDELDVVLLKADWTHQDPQISQALAGFNRSAVPFNLIYGPDTPSPVILPEILTPGIVLDALEQVRGKN